MANPSARLIKVFHYQCTYRPIPVLLCDVRTGIFGPRFFRVQPNLGEGSNACAKLGGVIRYVFSEDATTIKSNPP